jgi:MFS family permease
MQQMTPDRRIDWRTIVFLNAVSILSQIGQFGFGIVVLPLWLTRHGLNAAQLGIFASSVWFGMLVGLAIAPGLNVRFGYRAVIVAGLLVSMLGFAAIAATGWPDWLAAAVLIGLGMGLRWIGLEPWLYHIAPNDARGRLVGFHETMIGIAPIVAPMLAKWGGIAGNMTLFTGMAFTGSALLPLAFTRPTPAAQTEPPAGNNAGSLQRRILALGIAVGVIAGISEAAFSGLFPIFGLGRSLGTDQIATLLAVFGLGGLLLQYPVGWVADHRGLRFAILICAASTAILAIIAALPIGFTGLAITIFALGGTITAYLTLSIIAATKAGDGDLSINVRKVSMVYTASSIFGPLIAGTAIKTLGSEALLWQVGLLAAILCGYVLLFTRAAFPEAGRTSC